MLSFPIMNEELSDTWSLCVGRILTSLYLWNHLRFINSTLMSLPLLTNANIHFIVCLRVKIQLLDNMDSFLRFPKSMIETDYWKTFSEYFHTTNRNCCHPDKNLTLEHTPNRIPNNLVGVYVVKYLWTKGFWWTFITTWKIWTFVQHN